MSECSFLPPPPVPPPSFEVAIAQSNKTFESPIDENQTENNENENQKADADKKESTSTEDDDTFEESLSSNDSSLLNKTTIDNSFENDVGNISEDDVFTVENFNC